MKEVGCKNEKEESVYAKFQKRSPEAIVSMAQYLIDKFKFKSIENEKNGIIYQKEEGGSFKRGRKPIAENIMRILNRRTKSTPYIINEVTDEIRFKTKTDIKTLTKKELNEFKLLR